MDVPKSKRHGITYQYFHDAIANTNKKGKRWMKPFLKKYREELTPLRSAGLDMSSIIPVTPEEIKDVEEQKEPMMMIDLQAFNYIFHYSCLKEFFGLQGTKWYGGECCPMFPPGELSCFRLQFELYPSLWEEERGGTGFEHNVRKILMGPADPNPAKATYRGWSTILLNDPYLPLPRVVKAYYKHLMQVIQETAPKCEYIIGDPPSIIKEYSKLPEPMLDPNDKEIFLERFKEQYPEETTQNKQNDQGGHDQQHFNNWLHRQNLQNANTAMRINAKYGPY